MNKAPELIRALLVDDDEEDYILLKDVVDDIRLSRIELDWARSYEDGREKIRQGGHDVYLLDYRLGGQTGIDLMREFIHDDENRAPFILLTGVGDREVDLAAMKEGASDYLVKDQLTPPLLERSIRYSIHHKEVVERLKEREENFRSLLDSTFEGIVVHDTEGFILDINKAAAEIFGGPPEEWLGVNFFDLCTDEYRDSLVDLAHSRKQGVLEVDAFNKQGNKVVMEVAGKPYQYKGKSLRLTAVRDITSKKQMEAQILLQDRLASIGLMSSSLAHEIGTPLGVIRGRAEMLAMQLDGDPSIRKNVDIILGQIDRVSSLIQSLLNLARGKISEQAGEALVNQVFSDVVDFMSYEFNKAEIRLENQINKLGSAYVNAEAGALQQVVLNLLVNAVHAIQDAIKEGRKTGHFIKIDIEDRDDSWKFSVEDSGCGISHENMKNLFKPFFTTKDVGLGTGLGLATSYKAIEAWGGVIQVESEPGKGTEFSVILPKAFRS